MPDTDQLHNQYKELEKRVENLEKEMTGIKELLEKYLAEVKEANQSLKQGYVKL